MEARPDCCSGCWLLVAAQTRLPFMLASLRRSFVLCGSRLSGGDCLLASSDDCLPIAGVVRDGFESEHSTQLSATPVGLVRFGRNRFGEVCVELQNHGVWGCESADCRVHLEYVAAVERIVSILRGNESCKSELMRSNGNTEKN